MYIHVHVHTHTYTQCVVCVGVSTYVSCLDNEIVHIVLESRQVTISGSRRESVAGAPLQYTIPLNCTIWTSWPSHHKVKDIYTITLIMLIFMY